MTVAATIARRLRRLAGGILVTLLLVALLEGLASLGYLAIRWGRIAWFKPPSHTEYDADLGWRGRPGFHHPALFGPGRAVTIDARGFRAGADATRPPAGGARRVVCSGDSFTFGYGVDDADTWCRRLGGTRLGASRLLETVNLGEAGYGADQSYLRYRRDAATLDHELHLFAPVILDFDRMRSGVYQGRPKPRLRLDAAGEGGAMLTVEGVPVPRRARLGPWLAAQGGLVRDLGLFRLGEAVVRRSGLAPPPEPTLDEPALRAVVAAMLRDLATRPAGGTSPQFVVVLLPLPEDRTSLASDEWRQWLSAWTAGEGVPFLDLVTPLRRLPPATSAALFLTSDAGFDPAAGHYNAAGNAWVADEIAAGLEAIGLPDPPR